MLERLCSPVMKILFFTDHFLPEPSAPAAHVYERARYWVRWGHHVTILTNVPNAPLGKPMDGYKNKWRQVEMLEGIKVVRVKTYMAENKGTVRRVLDYLSYCFSAFINALFLERPDVVISTSPHLFAGLSGVMYALLRRLPHVIEIRDLWPASIVAVTGIEKGRLYRMLESLELFLYRKSRRVIAFTPSFVADMTARGVPGDKIDLVVNGANLELFQPADKDQALASELGLGDRFVIGYLGTIGLPHGLENVIHCARLTKDLPITFLFVGEGAAKQGLMDLVAEEALENVLFVGRQQKQDMPKYWSICNAALIHLRDDPVFKTVIPSKIFESMAMQMPIVYVGPAGDGTAIVAQHEAGIVVPPADPEAFASAVRKLLDDPEAAARFAANSLAAAPEYSREIQARKTLSSLEKALAES
jgi:glycosyltransferase involved in cell wall biosynthesis